MTAKFTTNQFLCWLHNVIYGVLACGHRSANWDIFSLLVDEKVEWVIPLIWLVAETPPTIQISLQKLLFQNNGPLANQAQVKMAVKPACVCLCTQHTSNTCVAVAKVQCILLVSKNLHERHNFRMTELTENFYLTDCSDWKAFFFILHPNLL